MHFRRIALGVVAAFSSCLPGFHCASAAEPANLVGVAKIDITPDYPIRLSGYGGRRTESEGVVHPLWAKALAIGSDADGPTVMITVDNVGVPDYLVTDVAERLQKKAKLPRERLAVCSSHTHTGPCLTNVLPTLFSEPIPPAHQETIDRYTRELADKLERVALAALADRKPARLDWAQGKVDFAKNRRPQGGPVDHDLPMLRVTDPNGKLLAILVNYACHCTALGDNKISGDWSGYAQQQIERAHPGAIALVAIGCGADADPQPRVGHEFALQHGTAVAREVDRLLAGELKPVSTKVHARLKRIELPFDTLPTREQWQQRVAQGGAVGYHAQVQLALLDKGETLPTKLDYPVQTWTFGDDLAMVFLPGEVVVDYSLRLKKEFDAKRLWVNAYSNDVPCYIPSKRILQEGGYEGGDAMVYYNRPTRFTPAVEDLIVDTVESQLPRDFWSADKQAEAPLPMSPAESLAAIQVKPGYRVELVAAEPEVVDPVAIDFGPDGRLWVVEMNDYPTGADGDYRPGGRVRFLEDIDGDGRYEKSTLVAADVAFPTGVMAWRDGALVCAAPDIIYFADRDRDGRPEKREVLFTGFSTENYQARVNGLGYGLDNWIHGANGLIGGKVHRPEQSDAIDLGARDFRFHPDSLKFEPVSGLTQQGRIHDDWGNWFGTTNGELLNHYPVPDQYFGRSPHVASPSAKVYVPQGPTSNHVHPISRTLMRFNDLELADRATSACGGTIYRDELLGADVAGDAFTCEPVHNLVTRLKLKPSGVTFAGERVPTEQDSEFVASKDNWFRPVQALTGPDGALWVVDMYRFVIEHPRFITPERLRKLDVRAGADKGRIYRIVRADAPARPIVRLSELDAARLVAALDSPNGPQRDLVQRMLVERNDSTTIPALVRLAKESPRPAVRLQTLATIAGLEQPGAEALQSEALLPALADPHPRVREQAIRLCDPLVAAAPALGEALLRLVDDADPRVRYQLAFTLGQWTDPRSSAALAKLAIAAGHDPYQSAAVLSSVRKDSVAEVLKLVSAAPAPTLKDNAAFLGLLELAARFDRLDALRSALGDMARSTSGDVESWQLEAVAKAMDALGQNKSSDSLFNAEATDDLTKLLALARATVENADAVEGLRQSAIRLIARRPVDLDRDLTTLGGLLSPQTSTTLQVEAVQAIARTKSDRAAQALLQGWSGHGPALRGKILSTLLSRDAWCTALLDAIESRQVTPNEIDAAHRHALSAHANAAIRERAKALFGGALDGDRRRVVEQYQSVVSLPSDGVRGAAVFQKKCAACHRLGEVGHALGPDLAALTDKSPLALLVSILDPNRAMEGKFVSYTAQTAQGLARTGMLVDETANSITLAEQENVRHVILRSDLEAMQSTGRSFMPEGLEKDLSQQDLADVIAFVAGTSGKVKLLPGNKPDLVKASRLGELRLRATNCEIYGDSITFESEFANIGYWHHDNEQLAWTVDVPLEGEYAATLEYSCVDGFSGNEFVVEASGGREGQRIRGRIGGTGDWSNFQRIAIGKLALAKGRQRVVLKPAGSVNGALMDFRELRLTPPASARPQGDDELLTPDVAAARILDESLPDATRSRLATRHLEIAPLIIEELTREDAQKPWDHEEEYRRIPYIWQFALFAGRRNDPEELRAVLAHSLPHTGKPLRDWQSVVVGGGVVNGLSQIGLWPRDRMAELLRDHDALRDRWLRTLDLAAEMVDNERIEMGTRYDALRILGADTWDRRGEQLGKYLRPGTNGELQMGAVSAASDIRHAAVAETLFLRLSGLEEHNRQLALDGLLRDEQRIGFLLQQVADGKLTAKELGDERAKRLLEHSNEETRQRAKSLLR